MYFCLTKLEVFPHVKKKLKTNEKKYEKLLNLFIICFLTQNKSLKILNCQVSF